MTQVALFLAGVFGLPWVLDILWPRPTQPVSVSAFLVRFVPLVWLPTLAAVAITGLMEGVPQLREELRVRLSYNPESARWLVLATALPIVATSIAMVAARAAGDAAPFIPSAALPSMIGMQLITGAVGEELGWRGFLLPRLGERWGAKTAAWVMGVLWSLWHVPAWFDPTLPHHTWPIVSPLLFITFFGVFMAFIFNRAGRSVLPTIVAHLSLNIVMGFGGVQLSSVIFWRIFAGILGALAVLLSIAGARWEPVHPPETQ